MFRPHLADLPPYIHIVDFALSSSTPVSPPEPNLESISLDTFPYCSDYLSHHQTYIHDCTASHNLSSSNPSSLGNTSILIRPMSLSSTSSNHEEDSASTYLNHLPASRAEFTTLREKAPSQRSNSSTIKAIEPPGYEGLKYRQPRALSFSSPPREPLRTFSVEWRDVVERARKGRERQQGLEARGVDAPS